MSVWAAPVNNSVNTRLLWGMVSTSPKLMGWSTDNSLVVFFYKPPKLEGVTSLTVVTYFLHEL